MLINDGLEHIDFMNHLHDTKPGISFEELIKQLHPELSSDEIKVYSNMLKENIFSDFGRRTNK